MITEPASYTARALEQLPRGDHWSHTRVGVFHIQDGRETQVGEYVRYYPSLLTSFFPFRSGNTDLALYSSDYTATRIMALPSCQDLGGEAPHSAGFCPVEFFVPFYLDYTISVDGAPPTQHRVQMPGPEARVARDVTVRYPPGKDRPERQTVHRHTPVGPLTYHPFGFVSGCIWGDDSSWKLQYLDLSQAASGILKRDERFGYVELPDDLPLAKAIDMDDFQYHPTEDHAFTIRITLAQRYDIRTGKLYSVAI